MAQVHECADLKGLAAALIFQALRDVTNKKEPLKAIDALLFFASMDFEVWSDAAGAMLDPYKYLLPNMKEAKRKLMERDAR